MPLIVPLGVVLAAWLNEGVLTGGLEATKSALRILLFKPRTGLLRLLVAGRGAAIRPWPERRSIS